MARKQTASAPSPQSIASYVRKNASKVRNAQKRRHTPAESVREADYQGHHIVVRTRYQLEVDGKMLMGHIGVTNDGQVHYHPVPNLSFASAIDMVKELINIFPDDFAGSGSSHGGAHGRVGRRRAKSGKSKSGKN